VLPTDVDCVNLSAAIYQTAGAWDYLDTGPDDEVYWGLKKLDGCDVIVFRGSITAHDWWMDLEAVPVSTRIGTVHQGFFDGMEKMWAEVRPMLTQPVVVTGHSLGAARSDILCGLMVADKHPPVRRVVFGEPRPGLPDFAALIKSIEGSSYRNGDGGSNHDHVCDVPFKSLGPFDFVHPTPLTNVTALPTGNIFERESLFALHHIELYQAAVAAHFATKETA
jgi:hypothetical protein